MVKLAYLSDFSLYFHSKSTVISQNCFFFPPIHFNKSLFIYVLCGVVVLVQQ